MSTQELQEKLVSSITPDDLLEVWDLIEGHIEIERRTVEFATEALDVVGEMIYRHPPGR